jgi:hypothetical protein
MGSGHFLVFALAILTRMRMEEEGLSVKEALVAVLKENLFGLEIDARCSQIAAFNLALAAWRIAGEHFQLPELNLACSGLGIHASEADWVKLAKGEYVADQWMRRLYSLFRDAPTLGSLIDPSRYLEKGQEVGFERVLPLIEEALREEQSEEAHELVIAAKGVLAAFRILASRFTLVTTNVPYLGRGRQNEVLKDYCERLYSDAQADLANCFVERCIRLCSPGGASALVTKQEVLFQGSYKEQRKRLLGSVTWNAVAVLGPRAFETLTGERVIVCLLALTAEIPKAGHALVGWDVSSLRSAQGKAAALTNHRTESADQRGQLDNPDSRILLSSSKKTSRLGEVAQSHQGIKTGDDPRMRRFFWEIEHIGPRWRGFQSTVRETCFYGGRESVIDWLAKGEDCARLQGLSALNKIGIAVGQSRGLPCTIYTGDLFDSNVAPVLPISDQNLEAIWTYCSSEHFARDMAQIDPKFAVANSSVIKVPFDLSYWEALSADQFPEGLPQPRSDDPSQWLFTGNPEGSDHPLQVAVARLVGFQWPRQTGSSFLNCRALNPDGLEIHADSDGIVPLNAIAGEAPAADRLRALLADASGSGWSAARLKELLGNWDSLEDWLRDGFFEEHFRIFQQHPFVWHVWDGRRDGFHALVNYHRLVAGNGEGRKTLERLIYTYLGRWIERQMDEVRSSKEGADARLTAATHLKAELEKIFEGEKPYDIFVRWKPLHEQPMGWEPDVNDGVRLNIRPWLTANIHQPSRREGCILRLTPRLPYGNDRGKEPHRAKEDFPWFWTWDGHTDDFMGADKFDGVRWNDLHYSLDKKKEARALKQAAEATR